MPNVITTVENAQLRRTIKALEDQVQNLKVRHDNSVAEHAKLMKALRAKHDNDIIEYKERIAYLTKANDQATRQTVYRSHCYDALNDIFSNVVHKTVHEIAESKLKTSESQQDLYDKVNVKNNEVRDLTQAVAAARQIIQEKESELVITVAKHEELELRLQGILQILEQPKEFWDKMNPERIPAFFAGMASILTGATTADEVVSSFTDTQSPSVDVSPAVEEQPEASGDEQPIDLDDLEEEDREFIKGGKQSKKKRKHSEGNSRKIELR